MTTKTNDTTAYTDATTNDNLQGSNTSDVPGPDSTNACDTDPAPRAAPTVDSFGVPSGLSIPDDINDLNIRDAAGFYAKDLGLAVHPLYAPDEGDTNERGKKPLLKGYRSHSVADVTPAFMNEYWAGGSTKNLGWVVQYPFVAVDLDSKADDGESVMEWISGQPELTGVPRERTGGGAHIMFICKDVPDSVRKPKESLVAKINDKVNAELYFPGLNIALSPSTHPSGHRYHWEVTGPIRDVAFADLARVFGFVAPEPKKKGRPPTPLPWTHRHDGDLTTLDLKKVMADLGRLGKCLDDAQQKWAVLCPWRDEHSNGETATTPQSDTIIFNSPGRIPGFKCLHSHCSERGIEQLLDHIEAAKPGLISANCTKTRAWSPGHVADDGRPQLALPGPGKPISGFAHRLGAELGRHRRLFGHGSRVVEVVPNPNGAHGNRLAGINSKKLVTIAESCVEVGDVKKSPNGDIFFPQSMIDRDASVVLESRDFRDQLPQIRRVLQVPIPMLNGDGDIVFPKPGYDEIFHTWLDETAPAIEPMELSDAKAILDELLAGPEEGGFWWKDGEAKALALARLLTPFCRGLMNFKRGPVWIFIGNREGVGKDTCANITLVLYTGQAETSPAPGKENDEEMRKRISSVLRHGAQFLHLANIKTEINFPALEAATDNSDVWTDRLLGSNDVIRVPNQLDVSISANNASWSPDLGRRSRVIELHCGLENLGGHSYRHPDILSVVRENRSLILSALASLVQHWEIAGRPSGPTAFASFPEWGRVVGGILSSCGYQDPCSPQSLSVAVGDAATQTMRQLFQRCHDLFGDHPVKKSDFQKFVREDEAVHELFPDLSAASVGALASFSKRLLKFAGRTLGGVEFRHDPTSRNHATYSFISVGYVKSPPSPPSPAGIASVGFTSDGGSPLTRTPEGREGDQGVLQPGFVGNGIIPTDSATLQNLSGGISTGIKKSPTSLTSPTIIKDCAKAEDLDAMFEDLKGEALIAIALTRKPSKLKDPKTTQAPDRFILTANGRTWRVDLGKLAGHGALSATLRDLLKNKTVYAFDMLPILIWLQRTCRFMPGKIRCVKTAVRILENGTGNDTDDIDAILNRYLLTAGSPSIPAKGRLKLATPDDHLTRKNPAKTECLHQLFAKINLEVLRNNLFPTLELEHAVLPVIADMTVRGIHVDVSLLETLGLGGETQAKNLLPHVDPDSGRVHSTFDPLGTRTGRVTSKEPNIQGIKRGAMREVFTAPPGRSLVVADFSNIDLRVIAAEANCTSMLAVFQRGEDLHLKNAAAFFKKEPADVSYQERQIVKAFNLGIVNGQWPKGMVESARNRYDLTVTYDQAKEFREMFLGEYPEINDRAEQCYRDARGGIREARTRFGRRRLMPPGTNVDDACSSLINTPLQGGTADGVKKSMVLIHNRLPEGAFLVSMVHDEPIIECPDEIAEEVKAVVVSSMIEGMGSVFPEVPIKVEAFIRKTWGGATSTEDTVNETND